MSKLPGISNSEWVVMEALWEKHPATAAEIIERLSLQHDWAPNTVRTMLARLVKKGVLVCKTGEGSHCYWPLRERSECVREEVDSLLSRIFGGVLQPLLLHFVQSGQLTKEEIARLRGVLDEKEEL